MSVLRLNWGEDGVHAWNCPNVIWQRLRVGRGSAQYGML